jgi:putative PIN family toxin of toxin-antitoxin system
MAGQFTPLIDRSCADELIRALAYPRFQLDQRDFQALLADYLPYAATVDIEHPRRFDLPVCRDAADQKFLVLAELGKADILVTGDRALLELSGEAGFAIESPARFLERLEMVD